MAKILDGSLEMSEFELQSCYYVHFQQIRGAFNKFPDFLVQAFKIVVVTTGTFTHMRAHTHTHTHTLIDR